MRKRCDFNMSWIMPIHLLTTCMSNSCPPLPTSFYRVSAVLIFRWYSHNRVGLEGRDRKPGARHTWEVEKTQGDATEENWAWWDPCYHFNTINTGSLKLLPLLSLPSPLFHSQLPLWIEILTVTKIFPIKPYYLNTFIHFWLSGMDMRSLSRCT